MAELKEIIVSIPDYLLKEIDGISAMENKNRNDFIREAMRLYIREREKIKLREQLKLGYTLMAEINIRWAELGFCCDCLDFSLYETRLSGCE